MGLLLAKAAAAGIRSGATADADLDEGPAYLWPECQPAWDAFLDLGDQWREGVLPRSEILAHLRELYADAAERREVYECVCVCARAVRRVHTEHMDARRDRDSAAHR